MVKPPPIGTGKVAGGVPGGMHQTLRNWIAAGRLDLVRGSLLALEKRLQSERNYYRLVREDRTAWASVAAFLDDLPGDLREEAISFFEKRGHDVPQARGGRSHDRCLRA